VELVNINIDEEATDGYKITAEVLDKENDVKEIIKCKYLIGADGGRSFVRRTLEIPFDGSTTEDKWVRIDGMIETVSIVLRCRLAVICVLMFLRTCLNRELMELSNRRPMETFCGQLLIMVQPE